MVDDVGQSVPDLHANAGRLLGLWQDGHDVAHLREAIVLLRRVAADESDSDRRTSSLVDLAVALQVLYGVESDDVEVAVGHLDEAIATTQALVDGLPDGGKRRRQFSNLANALRLRHEATGDLEALTDGVQAARRSLTGAVDPSVGPAESAGVNPQSGDAPEVRSRRTSNLALLLRARFVRFGDAGDADEAVDALRQAVASARPEERHLVVSNLADTLALRGYRLQREGDLLEAVRLAKETLRDHQQQEHEQHERGGLLTNAGLASLELYAMTGEASHVREAVTMLTAAMDEQMPAVEVSARLVNLSKAYRLAFAVTGDVADLDTAVAAARESAGHATQAQDQVYGSTALARALWARYETTALIADADESIRLRAAVAEDSRAAPSVRLDSARVAGDCSTRLGRHGSAADMYGLALDLTTVLGLLGLHRRSQEWETARLSGLAAAAAAASVAAGDPRRALVDVDRGRAIMWAGLGDLRSRLPAQPGAAERRTDPRGALMTLTHSVAESSLGRVP